MLDEFLELPHGVVTRRQALAAGVSLGAIRSHITAGRWGAMSDGVFRTYTGEPSRRTQC